MMHSIHETSDIAALAQLPSPTKSLTLIIDAGATKGRFAILSAAGREIWSGRFFDDDMDFDGTQTSADLAVAKKAVWLAGKAAEATDAEAMQVIIKTKAQWLTEANHYSPADKHGGKSRALGSRAHKLGLNLQVEHLSKAENPAVDVVNGRGYAKWRDTDLAGLVVDVVAGREAEAA